MAALLSSGFGYKPVDVGLHRATSPAPRRSPAASPTNVLLHTGIGEHFIHAAVLGFAPRSGLPPATAQEVKYCLLRP
jgi:hypothetical protein